MPVPSDQLAFAMPLVGLFIAVMFIVALDRLRPAPAGKKPSSGRRGPAEVPINRFARDRWSTSRILGKAP